MIWNLVVVVLLGAGPHAALIPKLSKQRTAVPARPSPRAKVELPITQPRPPKGLEPCKQPLGPPQWLPRTQGESMRYIVDVEGVSAGTVDFRIEKNGTFEGIAATEYRSLFQLDALIQLMVPADGRAASIVPYEGTAPARAMSQYRLKGNQYKESIVYANHGREVTSQRSKNEKRRFQRARFDHAVRDFVSAFYAMRGYPRQTQGCTVLYANQRAYTVWVDYLGEEDVKTPVGKRPADTYQLRYGHAKSKRICKAKVWLGRETERLPYKAIIHAKQMLEARLHIYEPGEREHPVVEGSP